MWRANSTYKKTIYRIVMKRQIVITSDGSTSIYLPELDEHYHSKHGAIQEAKHVFIKNGLSLFQGRSISILEIGFGTGLNTFLTYLYGKEFDLMIDYIGVEAFPVSTEEIQQMNYPKELNVEEQSAVFNQLHHENWEEKINIDANFQLTKKQMKFQDINDIEKFDLIYFDAFGHRVQPELWETEIFCKMYNSLKPKGYLVTYAARGAVRRSMIEVGFSVEKLEGPPGKREMMRAQK